MINYVINQRLLWWLLIIFLCVGCSNWDDRPNILFIAVDDLRPQVGAYGESEMVTPNLDRLADQGFLFTHHYVQVPTCGASRFSMLTGKRPYTGVHLGNEAIRTEIADSKSPPDTWPQLLRESGYRTIALGKIGHYPDSRIYTYDGIGDGRPEMPGSWDDTWGPEDKWGTAWNAFFGYSDGRNRNSLNRNVLPYEVAICEDEDLPDGQIARKAIETLDELKGEDEPFLLAVGFFKPHLPFTAPKKYWDLYERDSIDLSPNPNYPEGVNPKSIHQSGELFNSYKKFPDKGGAAIRIPDSSARLLRHGYYASVSYVDAQIGRLITSLEQLGLSENTKIIIWGDHGWHLGDHTIWGKHTNFERALNSTLIIVDPARTGGEVSSIVETVDIFPTILNWAGIEPHGTDGVDIFREEKGSGRAVSYFRGGISMRTPDYRLVWYPSDSVEFELYDHQVDPDETLNIAAVKPGIVDQLSMEIRQYYSGFYEQE